MSPGESGCQGNVQVIGIIAALPAIESLAADAEVTASTCHVLASTIARLDLNLVSYLIDCFENTGEPRSRAGGCIFPPVVFSPKNLPSEIPLFTI
jgi:hypothetical protein